MVRFNTSSGKRLARNRIKVILAIKGRAGTWLIEQLNLSQVTISNWCRNLKQTSLFSSGNSMTSIRYIRFLSLLTLITLWTNGTSQTDLTTLRQKNWYSDQSLAGNRSDTLILTDSQKPYQYEMKFLDNGDFYFSIISDCNVVSETGDLIPPGTKMEFRSFQYSIKKDILKIYYKPSILPADKANKDAYLYRINFSDNKSQVILYPYTR